ncbi:MAG: galactose oxidase, partial [Actinomycetia bacterium]|nr:galactose oxidase [Actinomycetes bacterium]
MRRLYGAVAMLTVGAVGTALLGGPSATANPPSQGAAASAVDASTAGDSRSTAAGSCWEIKQLRSNAPDGVYWLLTPTMSQPSRFYCDMTTDGGGWVLVAKGRSAWTTDYDGKGAARKLRTPDTTPMKARTIQYPSLVVDDLLGGARVDDLDDGVRLRRATNTSGTSWQEVRMSFANRDRWAWSFGAGHPLASYSFDGWDRNGGTTDDFGIDSSYRHVETTHLRDQGYRWGFAYGRWVGGSSASDSYLWSRNNGAGNAMPYTQMYIRPKVTSDDPGFEPIPNSGTTKVTQTAVAASTALDSPWGVSGLAGSTSREGNVEVQAFAESDGVMYVGGNFRYVQKGPDSSGSDKVEQSFLAAFDVDTGQFIRTFTPDLNEQVKALTVLPNGNIVAGGDFSNANGYAATAIVALDPDTGATIDGWSVDVENRLSSGVL